MVFPNLRRRVCTKYSAVRRAADVGRRLLDSFHLMSKISLDYGNRKKLRIKSLKASDVHLMLAATTSTGLFHRYMGRTSSDVQKASVPPAFHVSDD